MNPDIHLLQLTDPHLHADPRGTLRGVETLATFRAVVDHARRHHTGLDALLVTGDIVNEEPEGYAYLRQLLGGWGLPVYCLPGNHDDPASMRTALADAPFQYCGHADLGNWRLILLDSVIAGEPGGHLGRHELERLEQLLIASEGRRHVLIGMHHHPVSMGSRWIDRIGIDNAVDFFRLLDRFPHVRGVVWGHVHQALDSHRNGVRLLATPATSSQFLPQANHFAIDSRPPGYRRLTLKADGDIDTQVIWLDTKAQEQPQPGRRAG